MIFKYDDENGFDVNDIFKGKQSSSNVDRKYLEDTINLFNNSKLSADKFSLAVQDIDASLLSYLQTCKDGNASMDGFDNHIQKANSSIDTMGIKSKIASVGVGLLNTAVSMGISLLAGLVIEGVISFFDDIIHRSEKIAETAQKARDFLFTQSPLFGKISSSYFFCKTPIKSRSLRKISKYRIIRTNHTIPTAKEQIARNKIKIHRRAEKSSMGLDST